MECIFVDAAACRFAEVADVLAAWYDPGDTKKRSGWQGTPMSFPRIIPHSDGAGVIDAVGDGVDSNRIGQRVWTYGAQSYRPFGTAAQLICVPHRQAVPLTDEVSDEVGACLGVPGITAHRAVFSDGPVAGKTILVHGVLGSVSSLAAQLAHWGGATVIGTVVHSRELDNVDTSVVSHPIALAAVTRQLPSASMPPTGWTASWRWLFPTTPTWTRRSWPTTR